jgi:sec-independent protein translocase protein TatA
MMDIGVPELLIILAIAIIVFGPARIGGIGKSLGEAIRGFRQAARDPAERTSGDEKPGATPAYAPEHTGSLQESPNTRE